MALKHPPQLNKREWIRLMKILKTPPTEKQKKMMQEAVENGTKIKTYHKN